MNSDIKLVRYRFFHGDIHGQSCKKFQYFIDKQGLFYSNERVTAMQIITGTHLVKLEFILIQYEEYFLKIPKYSLRSVLKQSNIWAGALAALLPAIQLIGPLEIRL